jgi:predicted alpha-1,6-mannanase (GH76 family)
VENLLLWTTVGSNTGFVFIVVGGAGHRSAHSFVDRGETRQIDPAVGAMSSYEDAEDAQSILVNRFWDARHRLFRVHSPRRFRMRHWHYWWQAHALDALVDAAARRGSRDGPEVDRIAAHVAGIVARNGGTVRNDYYDDMAWLALAMLRAETEIGVPTRAYVDEMWSLIRAGWDPGGGIVWRRREAYPDVYLNTPANAPAALLAARLHAHRGEAADLEWARRIEQWLYATLVDPESGLVWDGVHPHDPHPNYDHYTYNQGTAIGASLELHRITGEREFLARAAHVASGALAKYARERDGILPDEGVADGGLFKGILARYLAEFVRRAEAVGDAAEVAGLAATGAAGADLLRHNAAAVAEVHGPVGPDWSRPGAGGGSLSCHLSAVFVLEAAARLDLPPAAVEDPRAPS